MFSIITMFSVLKKKTKSSTCEVVFVLHIFKDDVLIYTQCQLYYMHSYTPTSISPHPPWSVLQLHCTKNPIYVFLFCELLGLSPNFHIHVSAWAIYLFPGSVADRSWEYINSSQTHEWGNWDFGLAIPFPGLFVSNFRYWFFAVWRKGGSI